VKDGQLLLSERRATSVGGSSAVALALLAGFVASVAMVLAFGVAFAVALILGRLPIPVIGGWFRGLTSNALIDLAGPNLYAATAVFFIGGVLWAVLYGLVFEPRLSGPGWQRGLKFALVPWLFSLVVVLPVVGGGFLGLGLGAGPLPVLGNLVLHAVYGATLGSIFSSADSVVDRPSHEAFDDDLRLGHLSEVGAARGVVAGLIVGVLAGLVAATLLQLGDGFNPLAIAVATALMGAGFGGFIGSIAAAGD
jgi:hypothetical protein